MTPPRYGLPLSARELALLQLMSAGRTFHQAGKALDPPANERNARVIMSHVYVKLGAENLPNAILLACQAGILDGRPRRHGDHAGFRAHERRGEDPWACPPCAEGEREYRAGRSATTRSPAGGPRRPTTGPRSASQPSGGLREPQPSVRQRGA
ncbi:hypothetical protein [Streptomyces sp. NPDC054887]